jgi:hypothetical protein
VEREREREDKCARTAVALEERYLHVALVSSRAALPPVEAMARRPAVKRIVFDMVAVPVVRDRCGA